MAVCFPVRTCRGFTLLELVLVMAILAALAGIILPQFSNVIMRAHTSAGATNLVEINKAVQMFAGTNGDNYPNQYDSIVDQTGAIAAYVPNNTGALTAAVPTTGDLTALGSAGITAAVQMVTQPATPGDWTPTFYPYGTVGSVMPSAVSLTALGGGNLAFLDPTVAANKFGLPSDGRYVVFGLGKYCTIVGTGVTGAPVWYNPNEGYDPDSVYARFGLVFQTAGAGGATLSRAKFVGPVEFAQWGPMTVDDNLSYNYSLK